MTRLGAGTAFVLLAIAPAPAQAGSFTREVGAAIDTAYIFRGTQRGETTLFGHAEVVLNGFYSGGLLAAPVGGDQDELPIEGRVYLGFSPHLADRGAPIELDLGVTGYLFARESDLLNDETRIETYAGVYGLVPLNPALYAYYDFELETFTLEAGVTEYVGLGGLRGLQLALDAGYVEPDAADGFSYAEAGVDFIQNFGFGVEAYLGARAAVTSEEFFFEDVSSTSVTFGEDAKAWLTAGFRATF